MSDDDREIDDHGVDEGGEELDRQPPEKRRRPRPIQGSRGVKPERRIPAWVVVPLAFAAGFFMSGWAGGVFGLAVGGALWWMRR